MRRNQQLLESAQYSGRWYGVPRSHVSGALNSGKDVFLKIEVQGAETVRSIAPEAVFVFLAPGSVAELAQRLAQRRTEGPEELQRRLDIARQELQQVGRYDYCVVNRDGCLDQAVSEIEAIIAAEKCRVKPRRVALD